MYFVRQFLIGFILLGLSVPVAWAQEIPHSIPFSGTVQVEGKPFNGNGQFKFSILHKDCILVPVGPNCISFWKNDTASSTPGQALAEPALAVTLPVSSGLFAVKLGDTSLANMKEVSSIVFSNPETYLRVWFNDGVKGFQQLSPDRQFVSVPYAYRAETANTVVGRDVLVDGAKLDTHLAASNNPHSTTAAQVGALPITGGTLTGTLILPGNPTTPLQAAPKQYIDAHATSTNNPHGTTAAQVGALPITGGTLTGNLSITNGAIVQSPWEPLDLSVGWSNYSPTYNPAGYFRDTQGIVHLRGLIKKSSPVIPGEMIFILKSGYRPEFQELHVVMTNPEDAGSCYIFPAGEVRTYKGNAGWFSLDGITFRAK